MFEMAMFNAKTMRLEKTLKIPLEGFDLLIYSTSFTYFGLFIFFYKKYMKKLTSIWSTVFCFVFPQATLTSVCMETFPCSLSDASRK